jgi:heme-degrading monooxygenase HmoA
MYAVIFTSERAAVDEHGYEKTADRMVQLARAAPGFLGVDSVRQADGNGITVSYWQDLDAIAAFKQIVEHRRAQERGKLQWYERYKVTVCRVEREYEHGRL